LPRSYDQLAALVESSDDAIFLKSLDGTILSWNRGAERIFGYAPAEIVGRPVTDLAPPERKDEIERILGKIRSGERVEHFETERVRKDGARVAIALSVSPVLDSHGAIVGASAIGRDISAHMEAERALAESEARLAAIIRFAMDAIITIDEEQRVTLFNESAERMFRCPASEAVGSALSRFIPERARERHEHHVRGFERTGVTARAMGPQMALSALRADGTEFPMEATISRVSVGERKYLTVIIRDITERMRAEDELRRGRDLLEQRVAERTAALLEANTELEAFARTVSHDLRAPLRQIAGYAELALSRDAGGARELVQKARTVAQRAGRMVDDLLAFARHSRSALRPAELDMRQVVLQVVEELAPESAGGSIRWEVGSLGQAAADPGLIRVVWHNLLLNAIKFTRQEAEAVIHVAREEAGGEVRFTVRDNGVGFDPAWAPKLFGIFERLHSEAAFEGSGIGLATVRRIVQRHGGRTWAEGRLGEGATFGFSLARSLVTTG